MFYTVKDYLFDCMAPNWDGVYIHSFFKLYCQAFWWYFIIMFAIQRLQCSFYRMLILSINHNDNDDGGGGGGGGGGGDKDDWIRL